MYNKIIFSCLILCLSLGLSAQDIYHRAKIDLQNKDIHELAELGLEVDHGHFAVGRYLENDFSEKQIAMIEKAGFSVNITIEDVGSYYREQMAAGLNKTLTEDCFGDDAYAAYDTPNNFTLGTQGGFYTYEEFLDILDDMQEKFPDLISSRKVISDIVTHEDRPIYSVVMSDNPSQIEDEPKSLYTAIHHAREPNGLTQLIFFMWYMLENYNVDPMVTELLNETELHFIPMINPDGYIYNQTNEPDGGGFWRKNRRDNGDGTFGVDLNRNYGYEWGINDTGSSPNPDSDVYRGPEPFSEPETQAVKYYCEQYPFNYILNYHCFGNLLIYPWGFNDSPTPENEYFRAISIEMTKINKYVYGTGIETVGYNVNGDSDDWMYGEQATKPKSYAMTPEVGTEGFWPPIDAIIPNCEKNVHANIALAAFNLNYPILESSQPTFTDVHNGSISYTVSQLGLSPTSFDVDVEAVSDNVFISDNSSFNLDLLDEETKTINFTLDDKIAIGDEVVIAIQLDASTPNNADTISFIYLEGGLEEAIVMEEFGEGEFWVADEIDWFYDPSNFVSPSVSFSDSPEFYSNFSAKSTNSLSLTLPMADKLLLTFDLKVDIEKGYDFATLSINETGGGAKTYLCGKYSSEGTDAQLQGLPVYDGEFDWVQEEIDITEWIEKDVFFTLEFYSDGFLSGDGIYIDDWSLMSIKTVVGVNDVERNKVAVYPNPATDIIKIDMPYENIRSVWLTDMLGQRVIETQSKVNQISIASLASGMYQLVLIDTDGNLFGSSIVKK